MSNAKRKTSPPKIEVAPPTPEKFVKGLSDAFSWCRTDAHRRGRPYDTDVVVNTKGQVVMFTRHRKCEDCGYTRSVTYRLPGWVIVKERSFYPKGYLVPNGTGRIDRNLVRQEQLIRAGFKVAQ